MTKILFTETADEIFDRFFSIYDQVFTLPNEKESREGFLEALSLNVPHSNVVEYVLVLIEDDSDVAGANFVCIEFDQHIFVHINYLAVLPQFRGKGYARKILKSILDCIVPFQKNIHLMIEVNNPSKMSYDDYTKDTLVSGIDQIQRLKIWQALGFEVVAFPYVQPPLSADQQPDTGLVLMKGSGGRMITGELFAAYLSHFFGTTVLKGRRDDTASHQVSKARSMPYVGTITLEESGICQVPLR